MLNCKVYWLGERKDRRSAPEYQDWDSLEMELNLIFPSDYKEVLSAVGSGFFGRGLSLWNPCSTSEYTRLNRQTLLAHRRLLEVALPRFKVPSYPDPSGAVVVASMDNYYVYLRYGQGERASSGLAILEMDFEGLFTVDSSFSEFFLDLYYGRRAEPWAMEFRESIWTEGEYTFFNSLGRIDSK